MLSTRSVVTITGFLFSLLIGLFINSVSVSAVNSSLIISEINPFGSTNSSNCKTITAENRCGFDKWLEIYNPSSSTINLNGWSLQFRGSTAAGDNLAITQNINLQPGDYYLITYKEVNYQSTTAFAGIQTGGFTGKLRNLSSKERGTIQVNLLNPQQSVEFAVNLNAAAYPELTSATQKFSLEYQNGFWSASVNEFYPSNFGTPTNTVILNSDLDNQPVDQVVVVPEPKVEAPAPEIAPPQIVPEQIQLPQVVAQTPVVETSPAQSTLPATVDIAGPVEVPNEVISSTIAPPIVTESKIQKLIQQQSAVFNSTPILDSIAQDIQTSDSVTNNKIYYDDPVVQKHLWEYFFSYQAMGVLAIFFAISYTFTQKDSLLGQRFSFAQLQQNTSV